MRGRFFCVLYLGGWRLVCGALAGCSRSVAMVDVSYQRLAKRWQMLRKLWLQGAW